MSEINLPPVRSNFRSNPDARGIRSGLARASNLAPRVLCALAAYLMLGCANTTHMYLVQETQLGLQGSINPQNNNVKLRIGYGRKLATIIPKVQINQDAQGPDRFEAGSVFVSSSADFEGLHIPEVDEIIATGKAAENLGALDESKKIFAQKAQPGQ